jgi:hypothetical protein
MSSRRLVQKIEEVCKSEHLLRYRNYARSLPNLQALMFAMSECVCPSSTSGGDDFCQR